MKYKSFKFSTGVLASMVSTIMSAQETANAVAPATSEGLWGIGFTDMVLIIVALLLLIPIFYLSRIMNWSLKHYLDKMLNTKAGNISIVFLSLVLPAAVMAQTATTAAPATGGVQMNMLRLFLILVILSEVVILAILSGIIFKQFNFYQTTEIASDANEGRESALMRWWNKTNNFGSIEDEAKIDTGHNYDGIRELDNGIPAWFTGIFVATLVFGIAYYYIYYVAELYPLQIAEYEQEEAEAAKAYEAYLKTSGSTIDEKTLAFSGDKSLIENGQKSYQANCAACHVADGGGAAGPNLTDDNWIYGCDATTVFQTIKYGRKNGMMAWKDNFSDKQIIELMEYVHSLHGAKPAAPKAAQGEICTVKVASTDSTATASPAVDSAVASK